MLLFLNLQEIIVITYYFPASVFHLNWLSRCSLAFYGEILAGVTGCVCIFVAFFKP